MYFNMCLYIVSVFCLITFCLGNIDITDPCNPTAFSRRKERNVTIPIDCTNGTVMWQYPMSILRLHFQPAEANIQYEVCIGYIKNKSIKRIFQEINGKDDNISFAKTDEEVCTLPSRSNITLKIIGPKLFTTYAGYIPYDVYDVYDTV